MTAVWVTIAALTAINFAIRAVGPVVVGGRALPAWAGSLVVALPSALLTALVVTETFADGRHLVLDARAAGVAAAIVVLLARRGLLVALVAAAATTALVRALGG